MKMEATHEGPRQVLEGLVTLGLLTKEEADRVAGDIDLVMLLVSRGAITIEMGDAIIWDMAEEIARQKEPEWRDQPLPECFMGMAKAANC